MRPVHCNKMSIEPFAADFELSHTCSKTAANLEIVPSRRYSILETWNEPDISLQPRPSPEISSPGVSGLPIA